MSAAPDPQGNQYGEGRSIGRWTLAAIYLVAGVLHLLIPDPFLAITPGWVPFPQAVILGTGLYEITGAAALLTRRLRRAAGVALALSAVLVFPANIKHAMDTLTDGRMDLYWWYHGPRLLLQPVLGWWALYVGGVIDWPGGIRSGR